ncbi:MAG: permease-like cell division protein FtsX [Clostridia bacterium]|nr:permease-like cell division protein FtsX [Clostridia bacterium]
MKGASLGYLTKEGFRNVWVNRLMSLASITVLMACLVIIGLGAMLFFNINALLDNIESQNVIMVYIQDGTSDDDINRMEESINSMDNVQNIVFVSKEEAFAAQLEDMGSDAELLKDMENPLPDAFKISVKDMAYFKDTVTDLRSLNNVETVRENGDVADKLVNIRQAVTIVIAGMVALLFIVSLFIIANTIRITMFSRKLEISIMKAVGATNWFIRWPFMVEGVVIGIISSLVSFGVLAGLYRGVVYVFKDLLALFTPIGFLQYAGYILLIFMGIGMFTGSVGSLISMGKYLKEQGSVVSED